MNTPEQKAELQRLNQKLERSGSFYRLRTSTPRMVLDFGQFYVLDVYSNVICGSSALPEDVARGFEAL